MLPRLSLKVKVTLFGVMILVVVVWSLAMFAGRLLRADTLRLMGEQQSSMVNLIAAQLDARVADRLQALSAVAANIDAQLLANPAALQAMLERREVIPRLFNHGGLVVDIEGYARASVPLSVGRSGLNFMDYSHTVSVLLTGKPIVGQPIIGKITGEFLIFMAVPIKAPDGRVIGALSGVTDLGVPNFLDVVTTSNLGKTGEYVIVSREARTIIAATDKSRVTEVLPALGVNPAIDRFVARDGFSDVLINTRGVEVLASIKSIPSANWQLVASLPMAEVMEPIVTTRYRLLAVALLLTVMAAFLGWALARRELDPLSARANHLRALTLSGAASEPLPVERDDEIGALLHAFNRQKAAMRARRFA